MKNIRIQLHNQVYWNMRRSLEEQSNKQFRGKKAQQQSRYLHDMLLDINRDRMDAILFIELRKHFPEKYYQGITR